jgi:hypothetical protein
MVTQEVLLKPKLIDPDSRGARNIANPKAVPHILSRDVMTAQPVPPCGKTSSSPSKQFLKINVPLKGHLTGINRPTAYTAHRVTPNLSDIFRAKGDAFVRSSGSKTAHSRTDRDKFMLVIPISPIASFTVPVAVMLVTPIFVVPVVISAIVLAKCYYRRGSYQA